MIDTDGSSHLRPQAKRNTAERRAALRLVLGAIGVFLIVAGASGSGRKGAADGWVEKQVDALIGAARAAFNDDDAFPRYRTAISGTLRWIRRNGLAQDPDFVRSYPELIEFLQAIGWKQTPGHELGFTARDRQYFAETREYTRIPDFLTSQRFLRLVSRTETLDGAKAYLAALNESRPVSDRLTFFSYRSQHLGTPDNDNSYGRLLVVVPGDAAAGEPEKWVQFGMPDAGSRMRVRNLSVVAAVTSNDGSFNAYFKDYFRSYRRDGRITINGRLELGYGDDDCARCHKSGVLPILPDPGSVSPDEQSAVDWVNERFLTYGSPRFDRYLDATKFGPGLGASNPAERDRRFGPGFSESAVGKAMCCSDCHTPDGLGTLNWPMDDAQISSYIKSGVMPPGRQLTATQRDELYEKLIEEYFSTDKSNPGILKRWLLGRSR
jgi:hypothetical protein